MGWGVVERHLCVGLANKMNNYSKFAIAYQEGISQFTAKNVLV